MTEIAPSTNSPSELLKDAGAFVRKKLREELPPAYLFHNLDRILERIDLADRFGEAMDLDAAQRTTLELAVWFQDVGFVEQHTDHLKASLELLEDFLEQHPSAGVDREAVRSLILQVAAEEPEGVLGRILHDINAAWLGEKRFFGMNNLLRLEQEGVNGKSYSLLEWQQRMSELLVKTNYYTAHGRQEFLDRKIKNIAKQRKRLAKAQKKDVRDKTGKDFGRGVDTVYRVTFRNHINLSRIADGKANMIISINTVVLSVLITLGSATFTTFRDNIDQSWYFIIPVLILMITSLTALVFAVLSALPKVSAGDFSMEDIDQHRVSLLYFGNFLQLPEDRFVGYLRELKKDQEILYDDLSRDLFNLGKVLDKKYRLLTYAYRTFMGGLVLSMVAFLVIVLIHYL